MQQSSITGFFKRTPRPNGARGNEQSANEPSINERQGRRPGPYRSRGGSSAPSTRGQHRGGKSPRNMELKSIARETLDVLPAVLKSLPGFGAAVSAVYDLDELSPLDACDCPGYTLPSDDEDAGKVGTRIRVLDQDSFDAAIELQPTYKAQLHLSSLPVATISADDSEREASPASGDEMDLDGHPVAQPQPAPPSWDLSARPATAGPPKAPQKTASSKPPPSPKPHTIPPFPRQTPSPVLVLNLASPSRPGGGWLNGAMAQEESLCYRSSLALSLHRTFYPLPAHSAIYTPSVLLLRSASTAGHALYPQHAPDLPVTAVLSVAALHRPPLDEKGSWKHPVHRADTKIRIRVALRVAARQGHGKLVLGALGCGVFGNPATDVARCFLEVLREREFQGGWWDSIVFAVLDSKDGTEGGRDGSGNYGCFYKVLDGRVV